MEGNLMWEDFWYLYEIITGMEPKHRKKFEEEYKKGKKDLIELFGGTKIEIEKRLEISNEEVKFEIKNYLDGLQERMERKQDLSAFTSTINKIYETMAFFLRFHISNEDLVSGYITEKSPIAVRETKNMKISKALRMVLKEENLEQYADFLIQDLSILQQKLKTNNEKVKFVISVEPLDFLLASDATTGWSSCHAVDREHAAGNLSYLFDRHTAIAYAYREHTKYREVEVPKKIWRQWVFIDIENAVALFQRQYPTEMEIYSKEIRSIVGRTLKEHHNIKSKWTKRKRNKKKEEYYYRNKAELAYSDPTDTYIYFKEFSPPKEDWFITVGEIPICPVCGGVLNMKSELFCSNCAGYVQCEECGTWIDTEDASIGPDGNYYCEYCFSKLFAVCEFCEEKVPKDEILLTPDDKYICPACYQEYCETCSICGAPVWKEDAVWVDDEPYCERCFNKGGLLYEKKSRRNLSKNKRRAAV
jgi:hypothetical protein